MKSEKPTFALIALSLILIAMPTGSFSRAHDRAGMPPNYAPFFPYVWRTNIVVADLDRALRIYRDILGFEVGFTVPIAKPGIVHETYRLPKDTKVRIAFLDSGKGKFGRDGQGMIGLSEVPGYEPPAKGVYNHAAIIEVYQDIPKLYEKLKAEGLEMGEILELTFPTRTEFPFTDFDGHRIIIMKLHE